MVAKNVAYKVSVGDPNLPDGFITQSMETDEDVVEGFIVVPHDQFPSLVLASANLMKEFAQSHIGVPHSTGTPTPRNVEQAKAADEYQEFLKWKNNKGASGS